VPSYALLDAEGRLIGKADSEIMGMNFPNRQMDEFEDVIARHVKLWRASFLLRS
jgi:hypothetical protein